MKFGELSRPFANILMCERYEETLLIFPIGPDTLQESDAWARELVQYCARERIPAVLTRCLNLEDTAAVKNAFLTNQRYVTDAEIIFPHKTFSLFRTLNLQVNAAASSTAVNRPSPTNWLSWNQFSLAGMLPGDFKNLVYLLFRRPPQYHRTRRPAFSSQKHHKYRLQKASDTFGFRVG